MSIEAYARTFTLEIKKLGVTHPEIAETRSGARSKFSGCGGARCWTRSAPAKTINGFHEQKDFGCRAWKVWSARGVRRGSAKRHVCTTKATLRARCACLPEPGKALRGENRLIGQTYNPTGASGMEHANEMFSNLLPLLMSGNRCRQRELPPSDFGGADTTAGSTAT